MNKENKYKELETLVFKSNKVKSYIPRLKKELDYIKKKDSSEFFLTAFDITNDLKQKNIIIGPAKGYANSSLINFILGLTTIDPIKYDLMCEPFFNLDYTYLNLNVSDKKSISKKHLKNLKNSELKIWISPILKQYQDNSLKIDYKFNPKKLEKEDLKIDFPKTEIFHFYNWELERQAMTIKNENDLINSIAFAHIGLKGFHLSNILHNRHITFQELTSTNKLLIFQEQWINLVSNFAKININEVCKLKLSIGKRKYSLTKFIKLFPRAFHKETINYLFKIVPYLPSKAHTVAEVHILSLSLNIK